MNDVPVEATITKHSPEMAPAVSARSATSKLPYLAGLDGLRAVAVVAVLLYHADIGWMAGGFLGVEVFFVISGYLITSLLLLAWLDGRLSLRDFWIRRARRLLPALFLLLAGTSIAALIFARDALDRLGRDVVASLTYVNNWSQIAQDESYFEVFGRPPLLKHLWSLSVEEQFYLLWPLVLVGGLLLLGAARSRQRAANRVVFAVAALAVCSTVLMWALFVPFEDPSRVYYGTDTRAAGLLMGAVLAFVWRLDRPSEHLSGWRSGALHATGIAALSVLTVSMVATSEYGAFLYRGGFLLVSVSTALVIAATTHPRLGLSRLLSLPTLRWVGTRSYGIYLWHWPVFAMTRPHADLSMDGILLLTLRIAATLGLAELSYRFVESPIRHNGVTPWFSSLVARVRSLRARPRLAFGAAFTVLALVGVGFSLSSEGTRADPSALPSPAPAARAPAESVPSPSGTTPAPSETVESAPTDPTPVESTPTTTAAIEPEPESPESAATSGLEPSQPAATSVDTPAATMPAPASLQPRVLLLGDSVMLGAEGQLREALNAEVLFDAEESRHMIRAGEATAPILEEGTKALTIVVHLGTNGVFSSETFDSFVGQLDGVAVFFVTTRVPRRWEGPVNEALRAGVARWGNAELVDWHRHSEGHQDWFAGDQVHLTVSGAEAYASLIAEAIGLPEPPPDEVKEPESPPGSIR